MPYQGADGLYTVFPTAKSPTEAKRLADTPTGKAPAKKAPKAKKPKAPCAYGPRLASGYCPKKPKSTSQAVEREIRAVFKAAGSGGGGSSRGVGAGAGAVGGALAAGGGRLAKRALAGAAGGKAIAAGGRAVATRVAGLGARAALGATAGAVAAAGLASYAVTTAILNARKRKKAARSEQLGDAADAYRDARAAAKAQLGRELTGREQQAMGKAFKQTLKEYGLSSDNLKGL